MDNVDPEFPLHWFDREFLPITGIDVYAVPFDKARGWTILEPGTTRCLILKLETSDAAKEEGLRTLLGVQGFRLESFNRTADKLSADRYLALKAKVRLPREAMDRLLQRAMCVISRPCRSRADTAALAGLSHGRRRAPDRDVDTAWGEPYLSGAARLPGFHVSDAMMPGQ